MKTDNPALAFGFTALGVEKAVDWKFLNYLEYPSLQRYFKRRKVANDIELRVLGWLTADKDFIKMFKQADIIACTEGYENLAQYFAGLYVRLFTKEVIYYEFFKNTLIIHKGTSLEFVQKGYNIQPYGDPFIDALARKAFRRVQRLRGVEG